MFTSNINIFFFCSASCSFVYIIFYFFFLCIVFYFFDDFLHTKTLYRMFPFIFPRTIRPFAHSHRKPIICIEKNRCGCGSGLAEWKKIYMRWIWNGIRYSSESYPCTAITYIRAMAILQTSNGQYTSAHTHTQHLHSGHFLAYAFRYQRFYFCDPTNFPANDPFLPLPHTQFLSILFISHWPLAMAYNKCNCNNSLFTK